MKGTATEGMQQTRHTEKHLSQFAAAKKIKYDDSKYQTPIPVRTYGVEPAPPLVVIFGPKSSGKTLLMTSLVRQYTKQKVEEIRGTVTLMASKTKRLTFYECPTDLAAMVDASKVADLVILTIDAMVGLEIETFEMLNLMKTHGFPKVTCVITKLDEVKDVSQQRALVRKIKKRMWTEICDGIKVFTMSKIIGGRYLDREIGNLTRFVTQMKYRPIVWRAAHPYIVADQVLFEDRTETQTSPAYADLHTFTLTGYVRGGIALKQTASFHAPGIGDFRADAITVIDDPCPFASSQKKRLSERKKPLFAPMSDVRGMVVEQDAIYLDTSKAPKEHRSLPQYTIPESKENSSLFENPGQKLLLGDESEEEAGEGSEHTSNSTPLSPEHEEDSFASSEDTHSNPDPNSRPSPKQNEFFEESSECSVSDGLDECAVRAMFKKKEETEEDYVDKFNEEYQEEEADTRDIFTQKKDKTKEAEDANMSIIAEHNSEKRLHVEGIPPGKYVKVRITLPKRVTDIYQPQRLFLLGANKEEELSMTYIQGRVKRHKWFKKTLKTREAHYVSMGWRRFQTVPTFSLKDAIRNRMLKYIPDSMTCNITFYAPLHPPGTSLCLLRKLGEDKNFRIAANGIETEAGEAVQILKKLKLVGYPSEIKGHTVFVKDMFHTEEEAARYEGTLLKTTSGLRGQVKKAGEKGLFRATFEGELKMSDIIFLPCFAPIVPMKAYVNAEVFAGAGEIRLLKELREAHGVPLEASSNSLYREIEEPKAPKPALISKHLLAKAPLSMLEKDAPKERPRKESEETRIKREALEAIDRRAQALKEEKAQKRQARIDELTKEKQNTRKRQVQKMKDEAKEKQRQHKPSAKKGKSKPRPGKK
ncbi:ribosome biogenesis protein BMS1 [Nematocida displodere]|uniref:Ribosome biogenesis protein BMS1 n=1 Tax=Nematocida displodere TaxID=1805483 RepID=A0A177EEJ0_9MICR|nr:ribosome biogenesis protein BMS1 [Nematocida displodere]